MLHCQEKPLACYPYSVGEGSHTASPEFDRYSGSGSSTYHSGAAGLRGGGIPHPKHKRCVSDESSGGESDSDSSWSHADADSLEEEDGAEEDSD